MDKVAYNYICINLNLKLDLKNIFSSKACIYTCEYHY